MAKGSVLHCITGLNVGGAEAMLLNFLGALDKASWPSEVLSLIPGGRLAERADALGLRVHSAGMEEGRPKFAAVGRVRKVFGETRPDLAHGWMYHGNLAASFGSSLSFGRVPVIWSVHHSLADIGNEKPLTRKIIRLSSALSRFTAAISYCSKVSAEQHEKIGFDPRRRAVIPNGTDCNRFKPASDARDRLIRLLGLPPARLLIGHVGRSHPMKDQIRLVHAISALLKLGYDVQGVFIGAGHENGPVGQSARDLEISANITMLGVRDDVADLTAGFDLFVLSSAWGEAFPLAVAEAMACGVPVVATDVGDCAWLVGDTGRISCPGDTENLIAACRELLDLGVSARRQLGALARRRIVEEFGLDEYVRRHVELYEVARDCTHGASRTMSLPAQGDSIPIIRKD